MTTPLLSLRALEGMPFDAPDGEPLVVDLAPAMSVEDIRALEARLPAPLPADAVEALTFTRGTGPAGAIDWIDLAGRRHDVADGSVFPSPHVIAGDGAGNFWIVDLSSAASEWGPIWYVSRDPPVAILQADNLATFCLRVLDHVRGSRASPISRVRDLARLAWQDAPPLVPSNRHDADPDLAAFAEALEVEAPAAVWRIADLRQALPGAGLVWRPYGLIGPARRAGHLPLFAWREGRLSRLWRRWIG